MSRFGAVVLAVLLVAACSSGSSGPADTVDPAVEATTEPTTAATTEPTTEPLGETPNRSLNSLRATDAVPTLDQLSEMGVGDEVAACFVATIDPDGTGRVANVDLFVEAIATCL
jgi:PBP1b-binding outer membrane lipoprotein LpoB